MRLEHFQYIVEIARCKSMSKASKKLFITQPSLSTAIQNLEEMGFQIFNRSASGVSLTEQGEALLSISEKIVALLDDVKTLSDPEKNSIVNITLTAVPVFCNALMIDFIQKLKKEQPSININVLESRPNNILSPVISGTADIGIGMYTTDTKGSFFQEAAKNNLTIEPLFEDKMYCYLHRNHPCAHKNGVSMAELENDTPAFFSDDIFLVSHEGYTPDMKYPDSYYSFTDRASIKKAIAKGLAYAFMPRLMAYDDIYITSGMIAPVPVSDINVKLTTYIVYPTRNRHPKAFAQTIDIIREIYENIAVVLDKYDYKLRQQPSASTIHN